MKERTNEKVQEIRKKIKKNSSGTSLHTYDSKYLCWVTSVCHEYPTSSECQSKKFSVMKLDVYHFMSVIFLLSYYFVIFIK